MLQAPTHLIVYLQALVTKSINMAKQLYCSEIHLKTSEYVYIGMYFIVHEVTMFTQNITSE